MKMNSVRTMKGEAQDERLRWVGDSPSDQGAADKSAGKMSVFCNKQSTVSKKTKEMKEISPSSLPCFIYKVFSSVQMNETCNYEAVL